MNAEQPYWDRIAAYLSGHMSSDERKAFEEWLGASGENLSTFREAKAIWKNSTAKHQLDDVDTQGEWIKLQSNFVSTRSLLNRNLWMKIAASIAVVAVAVSAWIISNHQDDIQIASGDQVSTIYLPDSSKVWLNANSTLTYNNDYGKEGRQVHLQGEAFFDVRHDDERTFQIDTKLATIRVTGTSFNVKEDSATVALSVESGKVIFSSADSKHQDEVAANESATMKEDGYGGKTTMTDKSYAAWRKQRNPIYEIEKNQAAEFISIKFSWHKNAINQSVIKGFIANKASLANYHNIVVAVTYSDSKGSSKTVEVKLDARVMAGTQTEFTKRLLDIFKDTQNMDVKVLSAETFD